MINKKYSFLGKLLLVFLLCLPFSCKDNGEDVIARDSPVLVSTHPAENAKISPEIKSVSLVFDRKIQLIDVSKITLNQKPVKGASASDKTLTVSLELEGLTDYRLSLDKGAIMAVLGVSNQKEITLAFSTEQGENKPDPDPDPDPNSLVTKNPSPEAVKLYNFLKENYGKKIISGAVANVDWNIKEAEWVHKHTDKYPALNGFDYIHIHTNWVNYNDTKIVEDWWKNNGIVNCMWHWNVPVSQGSTSYAFYTSPHLNDQGKDEGTTFDISKAVQEGTYENGIVKADMEKIADRLLLLKNKNIPVIWRPLHEAAGGWFWWGAKGAAPCKALWKLMFETFEAKGLNNLIWVWTAEPNDNAWYPGDEYVDIVGRDLYNKPKASDVLVEYNTLKNRYPNKMVTLSEFGNVAKITDQLNAGATWSWFMSWYDYNRTNNTGSSAFNSEEHQYANAAYWKATFENDKVISRDQMPSLK
jgi:mannan endo-1,4-beta-mannosidase